MSLRTRAARQLQSSLRLAMRRIPIALKDKNALNLNDLVIKSVSSALMKELLDLIAQNSWWVPPKVYEKISVVYPKTRRMHSKEKKGNVVDGDIRLWTN